MKNLHCNMVYCLATLLFICLTNESARADFVNPTTVANKPLFFKATVDITDLTSAGIVLGGPDFDGDSGNWSAVVMQTAVDGDGINNDLLFELFHNIAPHPGLGETALNLVFSSEGGAGFIFHNVVPGAFFPGLRGNTPHGRVDLDTFTLTYMPLVPGVSSRLTVEMNHVPEPSTLLLLGTGLAGVAIKMRKRLKLAGGHKEE